MLWELCFGHSLSYSRLNIILSYQLPLAFCGCTCEVNLFIPGIRTRRGDAKHGVIERGQDHNCKEKARVCDKMKWEACPTIKDSLNISRMWFAYYSTECTRDFSSFMISKPWRWLDWRLDAINYILQLRNQLGAHLFYIFGLICEREIEFCLLLIYGHIDIFPVPLHLFVDDYCHWPCDTLYADSFGNSTTMSITHVCKCKQWSVYECR